MERPNYRERCNFDILREKYYSPAFKKQEELLSYAQQFNTEPIKDIEDIIRLLQYPALVKVVEKFNSLLYPYGGANLKKEVFP